MSNESSPVPSSTVVSFRLSADDHAAYLALVEASGMKPGAFFKDVVLSGRVQIVARSKPTPDYHQLVYQVAKAGNNLNQLAHRANAAHQAGRISDETYAGILDELNLLSRYLKATIKNAD